MRSAPHIATYGDRVPTSAEEVASFGYLGRDIGGHYGAVMPLPDRTTRTAGAAND